MAYCETGISNHSISSQKPFTAVYMIMDEQNPPNARTATIQVSVRCHFLIISCAITLTPEYAKCAWAMNGKFMSHRQITTTGGHATTV